LSAQFIHILYTACPDLFIWQEFRVGELLILDFEKRWDIVKLCQYVNMGSKARREKSLCFEFWERFLFLCFDSGDVFEARGIQV